MGAEVERRVVQRRERLDQGRALAQAESEIEATGGRTRTWTS